MSVVKIKIDQIRMDGGTQPRCALSSELVGEYAELFHEGVQFPPVIVFFDSKDHWLADGFHRVHAASSAGFDEISADIRQGTQRDAVLYSFGANATHGFRRSTLDKQKAVRRLLSDPEWSQWSDREIARASGVSYMTVARARLSLSKSDSEESLQRVFRSKHGTIASMNIGGIGKKKAVATGPNPRYKPKPNPTITKLKGLWLKLGPQEREALFHWMTQSTQAESETNSVEL